MPRRAAPGWRFFTAFSIAIVAAAILLPRLGFDGGDLRVHAASALTFLVVGGWSLAAVEDGQPLHATIAGLLMLAAAAMSFTGVFLPDLVPTRLSWSMALAGSFSAIGLELVMDRWAGDLLER